MRVVPLIFPLFVLGCGGGGLPSNTADAVANYSAGVEASYAAARTGAATLDDAVQALVASPSASNMTAARTAWRASRVPYLQTEVFRFYDGPIDHPDSGPEGLLNAWPMDENYVDYVVGDDNAGLVNGTEAITAALLIDQNEGGGAEGGEKNISTGYHAVEFLLWGQDLSDTGPGERPFTDYVTDGSGTASSQERRGTFLTTSSALILTHLDEVAAEWAPTGAYRTAFEADTEGSFAKILTGMIILSGFETGGERLQAALDSGDREDEHSCFSDNTKVDMVEDIRGVQNVWTGSYPGVSGVGIRDVVASTDADLAASITTQIEESLSLANALQDPFENEILPSNSEGNARVQALIDSLRAQEGLLEDVFRAYELNIPVAE